MQREVVRAMAAHAARCERFANEFCDSKAVPVSCRYNAHCVGGEQGCPKLRLCFYHVAESRDGSERCEVANVLPIMSTMPVNLSEV